MNAPRIGNWLCTFTGRQFYPQDPRPEDVELEDIAHALSIEPRFGGHLPEPYSVAQHSVLVSRIAERVLLLPREEVLWALFHDAAEAYIKDIPRPLKRAISELYKPLEARIEAAIGERFDLPRGGPGPSVKRCDEIALAIERRDLFPASRSQLWTDGGESKVLRLLAADLRVRFIHWRQAKADFLDRYAELTRSALGGAA